MRPSTPRTLFVEVGDAGGRLPWIAPLACVASGGVARHQGHPLAGCGWCARVVVTRVPEEPRPFIFHPAAVFLSGPGGLRLGAWRRVGGSYSGTAPLVVFASGSCSCDSSPRPFRLPPFLPALGRALGGRAHLRVRWRRFFFFCPAGVGCLAWLAVPLRGRGKELGVSARALAFRHGESGIPGVFGAPVEGRQPRVYCSQVCGGERAARGGGGCTSLFVCAELAGGVVAGARRVRRLPVGRCSGHSVRRSGTLS